MHYFDMAFNIHPVLHPDGYPWQWIWLDFGCIAFMVGLFGQGFPGEIRGARRFRSKTRAWSRRWAIIIRCRRNSRAARLEKLRNCRMLRPSLEEVLLNEF